MIFKKKPQSKSYYRNTKAYKRKHRKNYNLIGKLSNFLCAWLIFNVVAATIMFFYLLMCMITDKEGNDAVLGFILFSVVVDFIIIGILAIITRYQNKNNNSKF